jgi:hypothetical protein
VVLRRLRYHLNLLLGEPFPEANIGTDYLAAFQMMGLSVHRQSKVMAGRCGVEHILVDIVVPAHGQGTLNYRPGMVFPVRLVKGRIAGNNLVLYVLDK